MISKKHLFFITTCLCLSLEIFALDLVTFNYPPFLQKDEQGFVDRLLVDFKKTSNIKFNVEKFPVKRALSYYQTGQYYFHLGASDNLSKKELSDSFIVPIFDLNVYLLFSESNKEKLQKDLSTLKNIKIGILRGSQQEEEFAKKHGFSITTYNDSENAFNLLKKGRVDFITFSPLFNNYQDISGESTIDDFIYHKDLCYKTEAAFFINKSHTNANELHKELSININKYLKSSEYSKLLKITFKDDIPKGVIKYTREEL